MSFSFKRPDERLTAKLIALVNLHAEGAISGRFILVTKKRGLPVRRKARSTIVLGDKS
jgi:hypothetical protein